jgi:hypothetical protein
MGTPVTAFTLRAARTAGVSVELREDDAVEFQCFVEGLCAVDGVLTGHGVTDEQCLVGVDRRVDLLEFLHQGGIDVESAGGVQNDDFGTEPLCFPDAVATDLNGIACSRIFTVNRAANLSTDDFQLFDRGGSLKVGGDQKRRDALSFESRGELTAGGGFTGTLQAAHHNDRGAIAADWERMIDGAHQADEFLMDNTNDLLFGAEGLEDLFAHGLAGDSFARTVAQRRRQRPLRAMQSGLAACLRGCWLR